MIKSHTHNRQGAAVTNFDTQLPEPHAQLAKDTLKYPYIFEFLTLEKPFRERELEMIDKQWLHIASRSQPTDAESLWMVIRTNISPAKSSLWVLPPA